MLVPFPQLHTYLETACAPCLSVCTFNYLIFSTVHQAMEEEVLLTYRLLSQERECIRIHTSSITSYRWINLANQDEMLSRGGSPLVPMTIQECILCTLKSSRIVHCARSTKKGKSAASAISVWLHRYTTCALGGLTSEIERDLVLSNEFGCNAHSYKKE